MGSWQKRVHLIAAIGFFILAIGAAYYRRQTGGGSHWQWFAMMCLFASGAAVLLFYRQMKQSLKDEQDSRTSDQVPGFPEGQAHLIDSGRLPHRFNAAVDLQDGEICHFYFPAQRLLFQPPPASWKISPDQLAIRFSGGQYYFIIRPQEFLLLAEPDSEWDGNFVITNQRALFIAAQNGFAVPLRHIRALDCSARLIDFQVHGHRYTLRSDAANYAEKVLYLLFGNRPPNG